MVLRAFVRAFSTRHVAEFPTRDRDAKTYIARDHKVPIEAVRYSIEATMLILKRRNRISIMTWRFVHS